ncbi:MAG: thioredoxin domain-containing protein [Gammaproteobacteria bacterium]|nr:thioredoxin domain-containing protein [Gammaproteobacteria bacterium]
MPNRLKNSTSPYLLQHAGNPVDWHPWDKQSLALAVHSDKPILLSIGYSACHWCHVMERECFQDQEIAEIMNDHFVCIKVDREERPDLDRIYQIAYQILNHKPGGWPLNLCLTPRGYAPFFAGTYFPPEPRFHLPSFRTVLEQAAKHYRLNREKLAGHHVSFAAAIEQMNPRQPTGDFPDADKLLLSAINTLQGEFDAVHGGFGRPPKFPHPTQLDLLMIGTQSPQTSISRRCSQMVVFTLLRMAGSGLFDQLGGGFFRYSVDREWAIPHFEKMLYDNSQLLFTYSIAFMHFKTPIYERIIKETANWVISEMQGEAGGYYSTLDADSEDQEGKYYVWSETDLRAVLPDPLYRRLEQQYGLFGEPNFEGCWHFNLNRETDLETLNEHPDVMPEFYQARQKLMEIRNTRQRPAMDNKILTAWNGLMIKGMAKAARILNQPAYLGSAQQAIQFVRSNLWRGDRLMACCTEGKTTLNGYLDDYAFMLEGVLEMLATRWNSADLHFAIRVSEVMLERFEDTEEGGFYFSSHDHEQLLCRLKPGADDAIPSGNASAIRGLYNLGTLTGNPQYLESANRAIQLFADELKRQPSVNASMVIALQQIKHGATVILRANSTEQQAWQEALSETIHPLINVYHINSDESGLPDSLAGKQPEVGGTAYICRGTSCGEPVTSPETLLEALSEFTR